jgi:hypothetical protein
MGSEFDHKTNEDAKKRRVQGVETRPDDITWEDIDPADFFDPEEFGYRSRANASRL